MKNVLLKATAVAALCALSSNSFASDDACTGQEIHCIRTVGLSSSPTEGRIIKFSVSMAEGTFSGTTCVSGIPDGIGIMQEDAEPGHASYSISICKDLEGHRCKPISNYSIDITGTPGHYVANPKETVLDFTAYASKYPECTVTELDRKRTARALK